MNINPLIESVFDNFTVDNVVIPIAHLHYKGKESTYLSYYTWSESPEEFADDVPILEGTYATIDIYSKRNFKNVLRQVKKTLKENGFTVTDTGPEDYEEDTGFYHVPVNFYYESEVDY